MHALLRRAKATAILFAFGGGVDVAAQLDEHDSLVARGVVPDAVIGDGTGEISAAYAAGALSREDALALGFDRHVRADARPAQRPLYVATSGRDVSDDPPLDARYWRWMARHSFPVAEAVAAAIADGYRTALVVGPRGDATDWAGLELRERAPRRRRRPSPEGGNGPHGPVRRIAGQNTWLVTGHDEVRSVLAQPAVFSSRVFADVDTSLLSLDPPEHSVPRAALRPLLAGPAIADLEDFAKEIADQLVHDMAAQDECDVIACLSQPLVEGVLAHLLGIDRGVSQEFAVSARGTKVEPDRHRIGPALATLERPPKLLATLAEVPGITAEQADALVRFLWLAGNVTTRRFIGSAVLVLSEEPEVRARITADAALLPRFLEEVLRLHPPEHAIARETTQDTELGGVPIPAGALVRVSFAEANRDPRRFPDPDRVRLDRPLHHISFGVGPHRCPGARLARAEAAAAVRALLARMPDFVALQPPAALRYARWTDTPVLEQLVIAPAG